MDNKTESQALSLESRVLNWAKEKGIDKPENLLRQALKLTSEAGKFADDVARGDTEHAKMELGDVLVVCTILAKQLNTTTLSCMSAAYSKIKNQKGEIINGTFIKESDIYKKSVWVFDDHFEQGWRFNEVIGDRFLFVPSDVAKTKEEATGILAVDFDILKKHAGVSCSFNDSEFMLSDCVVVINEKT